MNTTREGYHGSNPFRPPRAFAAGPVTVAPTVHFYVLSEDFTQVTSLGHTAAVKAWAGATLTWSRPLTKVPTTSE